MNFKSGIWTAETSKKKKWNHFNVLIRIFLYNYKMTQKWKNSEMRNVSRNYDKREQRGNIFILRGNVIKIRAERKTNVALCYL